MTLSTAAFIPATPVLARTRLVLRSSNVTPLRPHQYVRTARPQKTLVMQGGGLGDDNESQQIPQGFTAFSETLNGRAAMVGFFLAVATEALTGQGIVGQLSSVVKIAERVLPFN